MQKAYVRTRMRLNFAKMHLWRLIMKLLVERKCDKAMRRSKERCSTPVYTRWRCTGECQNCVCGMYKKDDGTWEHNK